MASNSQENRFEHNKNMDNRKNNGIVIGERFVFENISSECRVDKIHVNGVPHYRLQIKVNETEKIHYAYDSRKGGLVKTDSEYKEILSQENMFDVLTELCNLKWDGISEPSALVKFIEEYGFFLPIQNQNYWICDVEELSVVLKHLQNMMDLLHELSRDADKIDYNHLFEMTFYYIFSDGYLLTFVDSSGEGNKLTINGCVHPFGELWWRPNPDKADEIFNSISGAIGEKIDDKHIESEKESEKKSEKEYTSIVDEMEEAEKKKAEYMRDGASIQDHISDQKVNLNLPSWAKYFLEKRPIDPYENQESQKGIEWEIGFYYYTTFSEDDAEIRLVAEFLYNFNKEIAPITKISPKGAIECKQEIDLNKNPAFNARYKNALIQIAKSVYKREFDWGLEGIRPVCDSENFRPKWNIPSLLSALYFSLFYFDSNYQEYRICANETCRKWFSVPKSKRNKKYCSSKCANLAAQRRFQMK